MAPHLGRVYVLNQGTLSRDSSETPVGPGSIGVLDAATGHPLHTFRFSAHTHVAPVGAAIDERRGRLFVQTYDQTPAGSPGPARLLMLDATTGAVLRTITATGALAADERTGHIFVGGGRGGVMLDARTGAVIRAIPSGARVLVAPRLGRAYVADGDVVRCLDTAMGRALFALPVRSRYGARRLTLSLAVDEAARRLVVLDGEDAVYRPASMNVYDALSGRAVRLDAAEGGVEAAIDEQTHHVLAVDFLSTNTSAGPTSVTTVDTRAARPVHSVEIGRAIGGQGSIAIYQPTGRAVVTMADASGVPYYGYNILSVIDTRTGKVLRTMRLGGGPSVVGVDEQTKRIFVANALANTVDVLNAARL